MDTIKVDFSKQMGKIKPLNAVNNGPSGSRVRRTGNYEAYEKARISYARLHDSAFSSNYGGEYSVDVHRIFPDFNADVNDPNSYVFGPTDNYLKGIKAVGTEIFYRLGASIEHGYKKGTYPPKDFLKWAKICEHIILHYNEGWADGFQFGITYWEIWNEPDCRNADGSNPCWQGTDEEFLVFYETVAKYLKGKFPQLKIGGPAICYWASGFVQKFVPYVKEHDVPLDFLSYHTYTDNLEKFRTIIGNFRELLKSYGYTQTETVLNEWNYIRGWLDEEWRYSLRTEKGLKGSAFVAGAMCVSQEEGLDMLMYYEGRPCGMCGLFDTDTLNPLKTYYVYDAFADLKELGDCAYTKVDGENVYAVAATNGTENGLLVTMFNDDDEALTKDICIEITGGKHGDCVKAEFYLLNETNDLTLMREEFFTSDRFNIRLKMRNYETYLIKLVKA